MSISRSIGLQDNFSEHGGQVDHMMDVVHWFMLALFVGWTLFFLYCLFRFWHRNSPKASYTGVRSHLSSHLEIGVIIIEAVLLLGFAFPLWAKRTDTWEEVNEQDPVRVRVIGWQFGWTYHYAGEDGVFGRTDPRLFTAPSDAGIDRSDPNAHDDFVTSSLRLPVNRPAVLLITANDVIHNYAIKPLRSQQDAIPGREIPMWFTPTQTLETFVVCGQLCGAGHASMLGTMEVVSASEFNAWFEEQSQMSLAANRPQEEVAAAAP